MFVTANPGSIAAASTGAQAIGSEIAAGNAAAAEPTSGVLPPGLDEVSALAAVFFNTHAMMYQAFGAMHTAFHEMFAATLGVSSGSYAATEVANAIAAT